MEKGVKGNKNGYIIIGVFSGVAALLISLSVLGAYAPSILGSNNNNKSYLNWVTTNPGFYDKNKTLLKNDDGSSAGSFALSKKTDIASKEYYVLSGITAPDNGVYLVLPSSYSNVAIEEIADFDEGNIFDNGSSRDVEEIYFKSFYFKVGANALRNVSSLKKVAFANSQSKKQTLGAYCLANNLALTEISFASSLTSLEEGALSWNSGLTTLDFSKTSLSSIGVDAFKNTTNLTVLSLPSSLSSIGDNFLNGSSLTKIDYLGNKADWEKISLSDNAFAGSLVSVIACLDGDIEI